MSIGDNIRKIRKMRNISVPEIAEITKLGRTSIYDIETGQVTNPGHETLLKIAGALNVKVDKFYEGVDEKQYDAIEITTHIKIPDAKEISLNGNKLNNDLVELLKLKLETVLKEIELLSKRA